jgi:hypothetical protein
MHQELGIDSSSFLKKLHGNAQTIGHMCPDSDSLNPGLLPYACTLYFLYCKKIMQR